MGTDSKARAGGNILRSLQTLLVGTANVEGFLGEVAGFAADRLGKSTSCGITMRYDGRPRTVASSDPRAALADEEQYGDGEGPCLEAMHTRRLVEVQDQQVDRRWPAYGSAARRLGIRASLSAPLLIQGDAVGALNLYGFQAHQFTELDRARAAVLASETGAALSVALRFTRQAETADQLERALRSRSVIDQALGVLMGQQRCDAEAAFALLRRHSQHSNRKLRDVSADMIARLTGQPPVDSRVFDLSNESVSED